MVPELDFVLYIKDFWVWGGEDLGAGWMRFAGRKLSGESLMIASSLVGKSLFRIDEFSLDR